MKKEQFWTIASVALGVIGIWLYLRKNGTAVQYTQPNTSQSGVTPTNVPNVIPLLAGSSQPQPAPTLNFAGGNVSVIGPSNQFDLVGPTTNYVKNFAFNFPPVNLSPSGAPTSPATNPTPLNPPVQPSSCGGGCGCGSCMSCIATSNSNFPDGQGGCMAANQAQQISQALPGGIQPNTPAAMWAGNIAQAFAGDPSSTAITEVNQAVDTSQGGVPAGPNPTWGAAYVPMMAAS